MYDRCPDFQILYNYSYIIYRSSKGKSPHIYRHEYILRAINILNFLKQRYEHISNSNLVPSHIYIRIRKLYIL